MCVYVSKWMSVGMHALTVCEMRVKKSSALRYREENKKQKRKKSGGWGERGGFYVCPL